MRYQFKLLNRKREVSFESFNIYITYFISGFISSSLGQISWHFISIIKHMLKLKLGLALRLEPVPIVAISIATAS